MSAPSKVIIVVACENVIKDAADVEHICGNWMIVTRGDELPYCHRCKKRDRVWRLVTEQELAANDAAFLKGVERLELRDPDGRLGATERT